MSEENIVKINEVITHYFNTNPSVDWIPVKEIMPALIEAGIFKKDNKKGLPMRKVLRKLDLESELAKIPSVHAERRSDTIYWYLVRAGKKYEPKELISPVTKKEQNLLAIQNSDEYYLVNLCDELLQQKASRKHTFDTLVGNLHKRGKGRTKLPLDAYYEDLKLVLEFFRKNKATDELDEKEKARRAQIKYYKELKKKAVLTKKLRLIEINYALFENDANKLIRNAENDRLVLKDVLKDFVQNQKLQ
ncbi:hypothetical protein D1818_17840 [Aquimarina sp. BL5]|uniref:hypothetical protein n=1 Tax=Aquimarina sp. BL5 TaxID=1714860 RepID=UPI000E4825B3|nr:hypothetical protein [Aquimarina sp. BL5]AXT52604.1 hypothetical protein D1818_17840 [Aquimarina sp. BL5]RKN11668.1 hypothetical protein D7036_00540 [Aquimarina sp. BL5]